MRLVRRLLVLVLVLMSVGVGARTAYACSCAGQPTVPEMLAQAEVAFVGEVVEKNDDDYVVRVDSVLKGDVDREVTLRGGGMGTCDTTLPLGPILYASEAALLIHQCTPRVTGGDVALAVSGWSLSPSPVAAAGPADERPGDGGDGFPLWPVALGLGVLVLGALALRRKTPPPRDDLAEGSYGA